MHKTMCFLITSSVSSTQNEQKTIGTKAKDSLHTLFSGNVVLSYHTVKRTRNVITANFARVWLKSGEVKPAKAQDETINFYFSIGIFRI